MSKKNVILILCLLITNQVVAFIRNLEIGFSPILVATYLFGVVCDIVLVYIIFKQNEKTKIAKELEEVRYQAEKEHLYYQELEKQRMEMAKIRHDYNNLITSVLGLIHMGEEKEALKMLGELTNRMETIEGIHND